MQVCLLILISNSAPGLVQIIQLFLHMPYQNRGWTLFENIHQEEMKKNWIKKSIKIPETIFFFFLLKHQIASFLRTIWSFPSTESTSQMLRLPMQPRMAGRQQMGFSTFSRRSDIQHQHTQKHFKEKLKIPDGVARKLIWWQLQPLTGLLTTKYSIPRGKQNAVCPASLLGRGTDLEEHGLTQKEFDSRVCRARYDS